MNDEQKPPENEEIDDLASPPADDEETNVDEEESVLDSVTSFSNATEFTSSNDFDISAALAAVGSLDTAIDDEMLVAVERAEAAELKADEEERERAARIEEETLAQRRSSEHIERPPLTKIRAGQLATIVPGLVLMVSGAYLTFALSVDDLPLTTGILALLLLGGSGISLLAYWLTSGRWSRGAFLLGASLFITGIGALYLERIAEQSAEQTSSLTMSNLPMIGVIFGAVIVLSGLLCRPRDARYTALGTGIVIGSGIYLLLTDGTLSADISGIMEQIAPFTLIAVLILIAIGFIIKRSDSAPAQVTESPDANSY